MLIRLLLVLAISSSFVVAADDGGGFVPLFNGKDLSGWRPVNVHPKTFFVKDEMIITTGEPIGFMATTKQYENFIAEFDWMHLREKGMANSGFFVWGDPLPAVGTPFTRGIEVQVLNNFEVDWATSHGDLFSIWGARCVPDRPHPKGYERCLPSEKRCNGPGKWNHYKITANDGVIKLEVNGKEVSGVSKCTPRKGYLALESEGSECHFKNLKIKELPSTNAKPEETAGVYQGHQAIFNGLTADGWKLNDSWKMGGGNFKSVGKEPLSTEGSYQPKEFIFDWKVPAKSEASLTFQIGEKSITVKGKPNIWQRATIPSDGSLKGPIQFPSQPGLELTNLFLLEGK
jgi:hypothetical protein